MVLKLSERASAASRPIVSLAKTELRLARHLRLKRLIDLVVAVMLVVILSPILVLIGAYVALRLRTWRVLVTTARAGRFGKPMVLWRFRTQLKHRSLNWCERSHIDELPQLAQVVAGSMSLVGPRPEIEADLATLTPSVLHARTSVRPGLTGLWQVSTDNDRIIRNVPQYDLVYVTTWSLRLDMAILVKTITVFGFRGRRWSPADIGRLTHRS